MLPAAHRLKRSVDFSTAVRAGRRSGKGAVVVHLVVPTEQQTTRIQSMASVEEQTSPAGAIVMPAGGTTASPPTRAGFVVSKAVGNAVARNTVKRRLRHLVAERLDRLPAGSTLVVRAQPSAAGRSYEKLGLDLDGAISAARSRGGRPEPAR
jgi:ribonuclease P protein component